MAQRFALYYAPSISDALWERAAIWLGRDPSNGSFYNGAVAGLTRDHLLNITQSAGRYGFHATIKPPMQLAPGHTDKTLLSAVQAFCQTRAPIPLGRLKVTNIHGFLALTPESQDQSALNAFAGAVVEHFEPFRAPLSARERQKRAVDLSPRQEELLDLYGYPYVMDQFTFHMTLTDRLPEGEIEEVTAAAEQWFGPVLGKDVTLDRLALFHEPDNGLIFRRTDDVGLTG